MNLDGLTLRTLAFLIVEEIRKHSFHFFTAEQVAEKMNLTVQEVNRKFAKGELKGVKKGKYWYISESKLYESLFGDVSNVKKSTAGQP